MVEGLSEELGLSENVIGNLRPKNQEGAKGGKFHGNNIPSRGSSKNEGYLREQDYASQV